MNSVEFGFFFRFWICLVGGIVRRIFVLFEIVEMEVVMREIFEEFLECPGFVFFFSLSHADGLDDLENGYF